jgi:hypothetical protein
MMANISILFLTIFFPKAILKTFSPAPLKNTSENFKMTVIFPVTLTGILYDKSSSLHRSDLYSSESLVYFISNCDPKSDDSPPEKYLS